MLPIGEKPLVMTLPVVKFRVRSLPVKRIGRMSGPHTFVITTVLLLRAGESCATGKGPLPIGGPWRMSYVG